MSLIAVKCWYEGKSRLAKEFFGFSQPARGFMHIGGVFKYYSDMPGFDLELPKKISNWLKTNKQKLWSVPNILKDGLDYFENIKINDETTPENLMVILDKCRNLFSKGYIGVVIVHHLPRWHDEFKERGEKIFEDKLAKTLLEWREAEGNVFFAKGIKTFYSLLDQIGKKMGWDSLRLKYVTFKELAEAIKTKELPVKILDKRMHSKFMYIDYKIFYEPDIEKSIKEMGYVLKEEEISDDIKEVVGRIASPGKIVGNASIVSSKKDFHKVKIGDIIVSPMTTTDMINDIKQ